MTSGKTRTSGTDCRRSWILTILRKIKISRSRKKDKMFWMVLSIVFPCSQPFAMRRLDRREPLFCRGLVLWTDKIRNFPGQVVEPRALDSELRIAHTPNDPGSARGSRKPGLKIRMIVTYVGKKLASCWCTNTPKAEENPSFPFRASSTTNKTCLWPPVHELSTRKAVAPRRDLENSLQGSEREGAEPQPRDLRECGLVRQCPKWWQNKQAFGRHGMWWGKFYDRHQGNAPPSWCCWTISSLRLAPSPHP